MIILVNVILDIILINPLIHVVIVKYNAINVNINQIIALNVILIESFLLNVFVQKVLMKYLYHNHVKIVQNVVLLVKIMLLLVLHVLH